MRERVFSRKIPAIEVYVMLKQVSPLDPYVAPLYEDDTMQARRNGGAGRGTSDPPII